ncbi:MAG: transposase [Candidatus Anammoxibacter sp.]
MKEGRNAFHVTWVTHNSRVSERMKKFDIKPGMAVILSGKLQINVTEEIKNITREDNLRILAYNILIDHVHILIVCVCEELPNIVRKLKGRTAQKIKEFLGIPRDVHFHLWAQKFNCSHIERDDKFYSTIEYIMNNRRKHNLPLNKGLQPLVQEMLTSIEHAFDP